MQILLPIVSAVDALQDAAVLPPIDEVRPRTCPGCGHPAHAGERLGIVGHGAYDRAVLGVHGAKREVRLPVRRFFCRGCRGTISVLPDLIHPRRWWGAWAILEVLVLHLVHELASAAIAARFQHAVADAAWRTPARWRRQLLERLWAWWARTLGARGPARDRPAGRRRLDRLLGQAGVSAASVSGAVAARAAAHLGRASAHAAGRAWWLARARRGSSRPDRRQ